MSNEHKHEIREEWADPHVSLREKAIEEHLARIQKEFREGFALIQRHPRSVSVFGSSMIKPDHKYFKSAEEICARITKELGYTIVNGGGPGIMDAASRGAKDGGGMAVGLRINHVRESIMETSATESVNFSYFFVRKALLSFAAEAYIFFPGGFGTFDELFSILTLIQTKKIPRVPVILIHSEFWSPLLSFIKENMHEKALMLETDAINICEITDSPDRVIDIIRKAPASAWWRNLN